MADSPRSSRVAHRAPTGWLAVVVGMLALVLLPAVAAAASGVWNIARVGAPAAGEAVIAVVDSGVDASHPAFGGRVLGQLDFVGDGRSGDPHGHGTHVAGTAAGGDLGCGSGPAAIGVAPSARLLPVRVLDARGRGSAADVAAGIRAAADRGATVVNLSLGDDVTIIDGGDRRVLDAIDYAWSKGSIPVLAAGNASLVGGLFGSGYGDIPAVVVTATTRQDRKASYATSVGSARWGISAPGGDGGTLTADGDIISAWPGGRCALLAGTSMAAPHVSGALAVLRAGGLSPRQAVERMLATARPLGDESVYGAGLLDLAAATARPAATTTTTASTSPPPPPPPDTTATGSSPPEPADGPTTTTAPAAVTDDAPATTAATAPAAPSATDAPPATLGQGDAPVLDPGGLPTTASGDVPADVPADEAAAGTVRDGSGGSVSGLLLAAAAVACAGAWAAAGRAAWRRRR